MRRSPQFQIHSTIALFVFFLSLSNWSLVQEGDVDWQEVHFQGLGVFTGFFVSVYLFFGFWKSCRVAMASPSQIPVEMPIWKGWLALLWLLPLSMEKDHTWQRTSEQDEPITSTIQYGGGGEALPMIFFGAVSIMLYQATIRLEVARVEYERPE